MGLPELKSKVLMYVENADENQLKKVSDIFDNENQENNSIIALLEVSEKEYKEGKIHSYENILKEYNDEVEKGIADFKNGRTISHEDLLEEIKSWRNEV